MEMLLQWWPEMGKAVHEYANGGWEEADAIEDADSEADCAAAQEEEQQHPKTDTTSPVGAPLRKLRRVTSTPSSDESWRASTIMDYFSQRTRQPEVAGNSAASGSCAAPASTKPDTKPCVIRIDE